MTMLIYDFGWHLRDLGRASATAWLLFLLIIVIALVNYVLSRRFGTLHRGPGGAADDAAPGFLVYGLLAAFMLGLGAPALLVVPDRLAHQGGDHPRRAAAAARAVTSSSNAQRVFDSVPFWKALGNSLMVSTVAATSVVFFATLAGYAFAKLRFRGSTALLVFVVVTMAVPTQLGVVPLFIVMAKLGWTGSVWAVDRAVRSSPRSASSSCASTSSTPCPTS